MSRAKRLLIAALLVVPAAAVFTFIGLLEWVGRILYFLDLYVLEYRQIELVCDSPYPCCCKGWRATEK